jgi:membrane-bound lytic murein transglycosylase D
MHSVYSVNKMRSIYQPHIAILLSFLLFLTGCAASTPPPSAGDRIELSDTSKSPDTEAVFLPAVHSPQVDNTAIQAQTAAETAAADNDADDEGDDDSPETAGSNNGEERILDTALELTQTSQELWAAGDTGKAIEALDQAYALILKMPLDTDGKNSQQKDDLRFLISKRLMEIYTSRRIAVNGKDKEIPLVMNEYVEREIRQFQTMERDFFLDSYRRSGLYRSEMINAFREAGVPEEITWLPLIESGFKLRALSPARALGLWQFIPSTGYRFGLKRNAVVDERLDPGKATAAAIAYLKELHEMFGDWATVLAAYNCGEGNVLRAIRGQKIDYLDNFWDLYQRLPRETARYYPRFIAVLTIMKDPAKYGFTFGELEKPVAYEIATIEKPVHLKKLAEKTGCADEDLANLNPELRFQATPASQYDLKVPLGKKEVILASVDSLPKWSPPKLEYVVHKVRKGDTLSKIASRYKTSVTRIVDANNLRKTKQLRVGQRLKIPVRTTS